MARRTTRSGDEIPRDIEVDITDGAHSEEDPDADIDELDFFSDED